jgi:hypothetical protein
MDIQHLLKDVTSHPNNTYTYQQLCEKYSASHATINGRIKRAGLGDKIRPFRSLLKERAMPTVKEQEALLLECEKQGIDVEDVKHFWHKSKHISMFVVAQNRPTYETVRDGLIKEMRKHAPAYSTIKRPKLANKHLLMVDPADIHIGKMATIDETGYHYDIDTAVKLAHEGVAGLLQKAQGFPVERILLIVGNDVLHVDNAHKTTTGGTPQDVSGTWHQAFTAARKMYVQMIEDLRHYGPVDVVYNPSNHDYVSGYMLVDALSCWFHLATDVTFNATIQHRKYYKYGNSLIATTHGDGAKNMEMPMLMAQEAAQMWADTRHRYIYQHHIHHRTKVNWQSVKDYPGVTLRTLRSPSPPDGWHDRKGYVGAPRAIEAFAHCFEGGEVARLSHIF